MAIAHLRVNTVTRANGGSAADAADYALGQGSYQVKAADVLAHGHAGPALDWHDVDRAEDKSTRRRTAKVARTVNTALPAELGLDAHVRIAQAKAEKLRRRHGVAVLWSIHAAPGDSRNVHLHLVITTRRVSDAGQIGEKARELDVSKTSGPAIEAWRVDWQQIVNAELAQAGDAARIDMRSFVRQGRTDLPTEHLGPQITAKIKQGYPSEKHARNEAILDARRKRAALERAERELATAIRRGADRTIERAGRRARRGQRCLVVAAHVRAGRRSHTHSHVRGGHLAAQPQRQVHQSAVFDRGAGPEHRPSEVQRQMGRDGRRDEPDRLAPGGGGPDGVRQGAGGMDRRARTAAAWELTSPANGPTDLPSEVSARREPLRLPVPAHSRKITDSELIEWAKHEVDLPGWFAARGYRAVPDEDSALHWLLVGPGGTLRVNRAQESNHWVWKDVADRRRTGTIIDACRLLFGFNTGQVFAELRRNLKNPPSPLPLAGRATAVPASVSSEPRPPRTLLPLTEIAAEFLTQECCLDRATVEAFAHQLQADPVTGHLVCAHNAEGNGEEYPLQADGPAHIHSYRERQDGPSRGRSVWHASPRPGDATMAIMVADTPVGALSAWQRLDPATQRRTMIVSTTDDFSEAGKRKLSRLIQQARQECVRAYRCKLVLIDASDVGKATTEAREGTLYALAASHGAKYERWGTGVGNDWHDALVADRRAQEAEEEAAREDASAEAARESDHAPDPGPEETQGESRTRGRGI